MTLLTIISQNQIKQNHSWKIQLSIKLMFRSAKDGNKTSEMRVYNNNIEIMPRSDSYEEN